MQIFNCCLFLFVLLIFSKTGSASYVKRNMNLFINLGIKSQYVLFKIKFEVSSAWIVSWGWIVFGLLLTLWTLPARTHFLVDVAIKNTTFSWFTRKLDFSQIWRIRQRVDRVLVHIHVESRQKLWSSFREAQIAAIRRSLTNFSPHYHYVQLNVIKRWRPIYHFIPYRNYCYNTRVATP